MKNIHENFCFSPSHKPSLQSTIQTRLRLVVKNLKRNSSMALLERGLLLDLINLCRSSRFLNAFASFHLIVWLKELNKTFHVLIICRGKLGENRKLRNESWEKVKRNFLFFSRILKFWKWNLFSKKDLGEIRTSPPRTFIWWISIWRIVYLSCISLIQGTFP